MLVLRAHRRDRTDSLPGFNRTLFHLSLEGMYCVGPETLEVSDY